MWSNLATKKRAERSPRHLRQDPLADGRIQAQHAAAVADEGLAVLENLGVVFPLRVEKIERALLLSLEKRSFSIADAHAAGEDHTLHPLDSGPAGCVFKLSDVLADVGYQVDMACGVPSALALLWPRAYDVVLLDIRMFGMDGRTLCEEIKKLRPGVVVIVITAYASHGSAEAALADGAWQVLCKPVDFPRLLQCLNEAVSQRMSWVALLPPSDTT